MPERNECIRLLVYAISWGDFMQASRDIISKSPDKTRYVIKLHRPSEGIILKVTDNKHSIMYRLSKNDNLKKIEALNSLFLTWGSSENADEAFPLKLSRSADKTTNELKAKKST